MITEDYVSFETAKLLKERGFNSSVTSFYEEDGNPCVELYASKELDWNSKTEFYSRPTLQMAMKWLREVHNLFIVIDRHYFVVDRISHISSGFKFSIEIKTINTAHRHNDYKSYEEACEAAIRYCLENLI